MTRKTPCWLLAGLGGAAAALSATSGPAAPPTRPKLSPAASCDTAGLTLPPGFCATVFADNLGHARHMAVAADGTVYVNTWSGQYYRGSPPPAGGFLIALKDTDGDGRADSVARFGPTPAEGGAGGDGIALYHGAVYAEANDKIVRYPLPAGHGVPAAAPETIVSGLPLTGDHPMHPFVIGRDGSLIVNTGSATNTCEKQNRMPGSTGNDPCVEQETRAGLWKFDANKTGQVYSPAARYVTGLRNSGGQAFDASGRLFATQHGRDQLGQNWPKLFTPQQGSELPAEELVQVVKGADYGWPRCYYDGFQQKLVLAPEYGGDGKTVGICATKTPPVAAFPAHWAPNDLLIYQGTRFPRAYKGGAFIAFHGSWNRAPAPQDGYNVVFQPMANGHAAGKYVVFADGFAGPNKASGRAEYRPAGLAAAPDGALYIADDNKGRIWRVTYRGPASAALTSVR